MPITGGCQCCLVIVALFIPPLAVAFATSPVCNTATYLSIALYGSAMFLQGWVAGTIPGAYQGGSSFGAMLLSLASILNLAAFVHAVCIICGCAGNQYQQRELGKCHGEHGMEGHEPHPMMPKNLSVQSSYMICDCRGAKGKNGLVKVRVPRSLARRRKARKQQTTDANGDLSTDSTFELEKTHMRRAMMPYVSKENHEGKRDHSAGEASEESGMEKGRSTSGRRQ
ncbi:hypothetical protein JCM5353_006905 [Sporobolomyces roseus]